MSVRFYLSIFFRGFFLPGAILKFIIAFSVDFRIILSDVVRVRRIECGAVAILVRPVRYGAANVPYTVFGVRISVFLSLHLSVESCGRFANAANFATAERREAQNFFPGLPAARPRGGKKRENCTDIKSR